MDRRTFAEGGPSTDPPACQRTGHSNFSHNQRTAAVKSISQETTIVETGSESLNMAVGAVKDAIKNGDEVAKMAQEIAAATQEQSASIQEVTASIEDVSSISTDSANGTQKISVTIKEESVLMSDLAEAAKDLAGMADHLRDSISRFKLE